MFTKTTLANGIIDAMQSFKEDVGAIRTEKVGNDLHYHFTHINDQEDYHFFVSDFEEATDDKPASCHLSVGRDDESDELRECISLVWDDGLFVFDKESNVENMKVLVKKVLCYIEGAKMFDSLERTLNSIDGCAAGACNVLIETVIDCYILRIILRGYSSEESNMPATMSIEINAKHAYRFKENFTKKYYGANGLATIIINDIHSLHDWANEFVTDVRTELQGMLRPVGNYKSDTPQGKLAKHIHNSLLNFDETVTSTRVDIAKGKCGQTKVEFSVASEEYNLIVSNVHSNDDDIVFDYSLENAETTLCRSSEERVSRNNGCQDIYDYIVYILHIILTRNILNKMIAAFNHSEGCNACWATNEEYTITVSIDGINMTIGCSAPDSSDSAWVSYNYTLDEHKQWKHFPLYMHNVEEDVEITEFVGKIISDCRSRQGKQ